MLNMLHAFSASNDSIIIKPLEKSDLEYLRVWRNDSKLSYFLRSIPYITEDSQLKWFEKYLLDNDSIFFTIKDKTKDVTVGSLALYNFDKEKCEIGKFVIGDPNSHGKGIGYTAMVLAIDIAFAKLNVRKMHLDVHENNIAAKKIYEKIGFKTTGKHPFPKGGFELEMELSLDSFYKINSNSLK